MKRDLLKHIILHDCRKAMRLTVMLHILCSCFTGIFSVYSAKILGNFAYAVQDPYLFHATVKDNILLGNPDASEKKALQVMKNLQIDHLAERTVSMNQNDLSGGEKQKISIARALLKNTPVLALDEPEANLDAKSVDRLPNFIRAYDKTVIFITHGERLLSIADRCSIILQSRYIQAISVVISYLIVMCLKFYKLRFISLVYSHTKLRNCRYLFDPIKETNQYLPRFSLCDAGKASAKSPV